MGKKQRLDVVLKEKGFFDSRNAAQAAILAGNVFIGDHKITKAGTPIDPQAKIIVRGKLKYVSRGGLKLEKALDFFSVAVQGKVALDIGASTGGFTDCLLQKGAAKVVAIDVGYGQFAYSLRGDPRVLLLERTNIREVTPDQLPALADIAAIDLSFISVTKVILGVIALLKEKAELVVLIKPQFEVGRQLVGKDGVVKDPEVHKELLEELANYFIDSGLGIASLTYSPILGAKGNIEFFFYLTKHSKTVVSYLGDKIQQTVEQAHKELKGMRPTCRRQG